MQRKALFSLGLSVVLFGVVAAPSPAEAYPSGQCQYGSTQARVQRDITDPWKQSLTINEGESFNVAGFHNHSGVLGTDVSLKVEGPGLSNNYSNPATVTPPGSGTYTLRVTTNGQWGGGCEERATVYVNRRQSENYRHWRRWR